MTHPSLSLLLSLVLVLQATPARAACNELLRAVSPTARFTVRPDGTATDNRTGLTWQRCPLGTVLDDGGTPALLADDHCVPSASAAQTFSWSAALQAAQALNSGGGFAGFTDWRVPNRKELLSIVETRCTGPAINSQVFPDTPVDGFFTSTPSVTAQGTVYTVEFGDGFETPTGRAALLHVRLAR
jgi:hypothetical protein